MHILFLLLVFLLFFCVAYVGQVRCSRLYQVVHRYPPCFREMPVIGSLYHFLLHRNSEESLKKIIEMGSNTMKVGGIARLCGLNIFEIDASDIAEVLTSCLDKGSLYQIAQVLCGNSSVFQPEHSISKVRRRAMLPSFRSKMLSRYIAGIWDEGVELVGVLEPHVGKGAFAAELSLGTFCFNSILRSADVPELVQDRCMLTLLNKFLRCCVLIYERLSSFWMLPNCVFRFTTNSSETQRHFMFFQDYANKIRQFRLEKLSFSSIRTPSSSDGVNKEKQLNSGIFDSLLSSQLRKDEIVEEIIVMTGASEEAAAAIGFALMLLGQYPVVQDRVCDELVDILDKSDRPLDKDDLERLRYLDLFVKEVFRLYPSVPLILRKAHREIKLSSGRVIPAGSGLVIPIVSLHRNPQYWGPDAEHFDPERFLPERLAAVPNNAYIPFSYGPRGCPAYMLGSYLVKLALCAILRRYKVVGTPAAGPVPGIRTKFEVTMRAVNNFEIELVNRM